MEIKNLAIYQIVEKDGDILKYHYYWNLSNWTNNKLYAFEILSVYFFILRYLWLMWSFIRIKPACGQENKQLTQNPITRSKLLDGDQTVHISTMPKHLKHLAQI